MACKHINQIRKYNFDDYHAALGVDCPYKQIAMPKYKIEGTDKTEGFRFLQAPGVGGVINRFDHGS